VKISWCHAAGMRTRRSPPYMTISGLYSCPHCVRLSLIEQGVAKQMFDILYSMPLWLLAVGLNAWLMGFALAGFWIVRRYVLPKLGLGYNDAYVAAAITQSSMLLYALIAALVAVGVWQRYEQVSDTVSGEATAIASLWRDIGGYPQPLRDTTHAVLRAYTEQIIRDAWPQQRRGQVPREGVAWMDRLQAQLVTFEPARESQKILHAEALRSFDTLIQKRRQRLDAVQGGLPGVLWFVLIPGAMGCMALFMLFHVENGRFHLVLLLGLAGYMAMVLFVIIAMDRPLVGRGAITADSYQLVYDHHMK
jgi:hypothetical protein